MITTAEQYNANLHLINNINPPTYATLPDADNIYNIDVRTREIDSPKFLAVENDNVSETIYFIIDRFVGHMDLASTNCVITYTNAAGSTRIYAVPFYDIYTYGAEKKIIIPWCLDAGVTEASGYITYAIQFFKVGEIIDQNTGEVKTSLVYNLNTAPAQSVVLVGMNVDKLDENYILQSTQFNQLLQKINIIEQYDKDNYGTYWTIID